MQETNNTMGRWTGVAVLPKGEPWEAMVRRAMATNLEIQKAADSIGISRRLYALLRRIVLLKDRQILNNGEQERLDQIIKVLEQPTHGNLSKATRMAEEIFKRHWAKKTLNGENQGWFARKDRKRIKNRFEKTLFAIREACSNNEELEVPILTINERNEFKDMLMDSMNSIMILINKLRENNE